MYDGIVPSIERVGIFCGVLLNRIRRSNRCLAILIVLAADNRIILIQECNQILSQSRSIGSGICCSLCYNGNSRCPSRKGIIILRGRFLGRISRSNRHYAILYFLTLQFCAIVIVESNEIFVLSSRESCSVSSITCNSHYGWSPTCESICVLCCIFFRRFSMSRNNSILYSCMINQ